MSATRASKRRKLDHDALPTSELATAVVQETPIQSTKSRGRKAPSGARERKASSPAARFDGQHQYEKEEPGPGNRNIGAQRWVSSNATLATDNASIGRAPEEEVSLSGRPLAAVGRASTPQSRQANGEQAHDSVVSGGSTGSAPPSAEASVNGDSTRVSGRKRQLSKKLEDMARAALHSRASPQAESQRRTPASSKKTSRANSPQMKLPSARMKKVKPTQRTQGIIEVSDSEAEQERAANHPTFQPLQSGAADFDTSLSDTHVQASDAPLTKRVSDGTPNNIKLDDLLDEIDASNLQTIRSEVLARLTHHSPTKLIRLDAEIEKVSYVVRQTVISAVSNSMVLIGPRGSGKSAAVERVVSDLRQTNADDFHVVRLNGFVQTDDKTALREIWRQLGKEMGTGEDEVVRSYSDTVDLLLSLLKHKVDRTRNGQREVSKSIIIIIEEFEQYAVHQRQMLLYILFDIASSDDYAPVVVVGITTRFDVVENLEKRVKSRFSHRQLFFPLARAFAEFKTMCKSSLVVTEESTSTIASQVTWNHMIDNLFDSSTALNEQLQLLFHTSKSVGEFQTSMLLPLSALPTTAPMDPASVMSHLDRQLTLAPSLLAPDSNLTLLPSLSTLELSLLIAAARLVIIHDSETVTFALAYDEYKSLASKARIAASASGALAAGGARVWGAKMARAAWEGLGEKRFVVPASDGGRDAGMAGPGRLEVSLEELGLVLESGAVESIGAGMIKWCKEL